MVTTDYNVLEKAEPLYPEMMASNASQLLMQEFKEIKKQESELSSLRERVRNLEIELIQRKKKFELQSSLFVLSFKTKEIKEVKGTVNISVVNENDARNW